MITTCEESNPDFMLLYGIFSATLYPGMSFREFRAFYSSKTLDYIDVTFIYSGAALIGFCGAAFYAVTINDCPVVIGRAATGILPAERGGRLPRWPLYAKYMRYKMKHPFTDILLTIYVANPLIYSMICRYTGIVYPRLSVDVTGKIIQLKNGILQHSGLEKREMSPFVVRIHFKVQLGEDILKRSLESDDVFVRYYLAINPGFQKQDGVLTIVPVTWENVLRSCGRLIKAYLLKGTNRKHDKKSVRRETDIKKQEPPENFPNFPKQNERKYHNDALLSDAGK